MGEMEQTGIPYRKCSPGRCCIINCEAKKGCSSSLGYKLFHIGTAELYSSHTSVTPIDLLQPGRAHPSFPPVTRLLKPFFDRFGIIFLQTTCHPPFSQHL